MNKLIVIVLIIIGEISLGYSQESILNKPISIKVHEKTAREILNQLSKQTNYYFIYNPELISPKKKISFNKENVPLLSIIKEIFGKYKIDCKILEDHIVIYENKSDPDIFINKDTINQILYRVTGTISDIKTKTAIPFASIGIFNTTLGVISNENGEFILNIPDEYVDSTLYIANIGYKNYFAPIKDFIKSDNHIELTEDIISIQEVIIRNNDPNLLIRSALRNIEKNYVQEPYILDAFYREAVLKGNSLLTLSEAIIGIYKTPYKFTLKSDKIRLNKSRKIINSEQIDTVLLKLQDGLYSGLRLDLIKNSIDFIDENNIENYTFQTIDLVSYNDKAAHVIEFKQKENVSESLFKGHLYIETESFALIGAEFEINFKKEKKTDFVVKKTRKFIVKPVSVKYIVKYRQTEDQYILSHVRADLEFKVRKKKDAFSSKYKTFFEMVIFNAEVDNTGEFNKKDILKKNLVFIDNNFSYDAAFWGNKNYILPEKSIEEALKQINAKLEYEK